MMKFQNYVESILKTFKNTNLFSTNKDLVKVKVDMYDLSEESENELYWNLRMNVCPDMVCNDLRNGITDCESETKIKSILEEITPKEYKNRRRAEITTESWSVHSIGECVKFSHGNVRDKYGNKSLLVVYIFLNNSVENNCSLNKNRFLGGKNIWFSPRYIALPCIKGSAVVFDSNLEVEMEAVAMGEKYVLVCNVMYDICPLNFLKEKESQIEEYRKETQTYETITKTLMCTEDILFFRRNLMRRAFINCFERTSEELKHNLEKRYDPKFECCDTCKSYIPVTSVKCEYCFDSCISEDDVIHVRLNDGWLAE